MWLRWGRGFTSWLGLFLLVAVAPIAMPGVGAGNLETPPSPPTQPASGPGGADAPYDDVVVTRHGSVPDGYWLFRPVIDAGEPELPLVVFLHGFTALDPRIYGDWIKHIVRRGAILVYPDYQTLNPFTVEPATYLPNTLTAVRAALEELAASPGPQADVSRVAIVGHSLGGILAVNYAAVATAEDVPVPSALTVVEPGGCRDCGPLTDGVGLALADLSSIPPTTLAQVIVGDEDVVVGDTAARAIWDGMSAIPVQQRDYITLVSDRHGEPALIADHFVPQTAGFGGRLDALDWYGTWKLFDALMACAFAGEYCEVALGNTLEQRYMGHWSDGTPVNEMIVTDEP